MKELKMLLNSLVKMGWKPFGNNIVKVGDSEDGTKFYLRYERHSQISFEKSLRELVSIESGLWQFVCENRVVKENDDVRIKNYQGDNECDTNCCYDDYEYRLIESALIPEEKLEKFLVENIIVDEKGN